MSGAVKRLRERAKLTQQELSRKLGSSLSSVQGWEAGRNISPTALERLLEIAEEYQLDDVVEDLQSEGGEASEVPQPTAEESKWVRMLLAVRRSGDAAAAEAVEKNLLLAYRSVRRQGHRRVR